MIDFTRFNRRPVLVAIAGPNGAGKTSFYHAHVKQAGLKLVNADILARELGLAPYDAMRAAASLLRGMVKQEESFAFETVFSDPVGDKRAFLKAAAKSGYTVLLCYIGIAGPGVSEERVAMRVSQGGHDVPTEKLRSRYPRGLANLRAAIPELPHVLVFDNSDLARPYRMIAAFEQGRLTDHAEPVPNWFRPLLK